MSAVALQTTIADMIAEYEAKCADVPNAIEAFEEAFKQLQLSATVQGTYVEPIGSRSYLSVDGLRDNLLKSGWRTIYSRLQIDRLASADDKRKFDLAMASPPALTVENAKATFGDYFIRPRFHILRGLAETFCSLDPAFKSHKRVAIGVKGLPKRVILTGWGEYSYSYARDRFRDMVNAMAVLRGQVPWEHGEMSAIDAAHRAGEDAVLDGRTYSLSYRDKTEEYATIDRGLTVRRFANGNVHVFFDKWALLDINRALAEFYGEVLPDAAEREASARTDVAKDLQFYWTPEDVVDRLLDFAWIKPGLRVLEPSCGNGRILDGLRDKGCLALGIEYHPGRAAEARAKGHKVAVGNFLEQPPVDEFDAVVMNPPFYGRHYAQHVRHAYKFLRPGGVLAAVLPASARYDHGELSGDWNDLPVASFAAAGTNIPTTMLRMRKAA